MSDYLGFLWAGQFGEELEVKVRLLLGLGSEAGLLQGDSLFCGAYGLGE
jgi:hypothetical protein